jgi:hypothetical protein
MKQFKQYSFLVLVTLTLTLFATTAFAQGQPGPTTGPSGAMIFTWVLTALLGIVNAAIQSGMILNQWTVPATIAPYFVTIGSFLTGVYAYISGLAAGWVFNLPVVEYAIGYGVAYLIGGLTVGGVVHHFGGRVNSKRPVPTAPAPKAA